MRKDKGPPKINMDNVIGLPIKNRRNRSKTKIFTCDCGGQLFALCEDGSIRCHGCRTKQKHVHFRYE